MCYYSVINKITELAKSWKAYAKDENVTPPPEVLSI